MSATFEEWSKNVDSKAEDVKVDNDEFYTMTKEGFDKFGGKDNVECLWRMARACYKVAATAEIKKDKKKQEKFLMEGEEHVKRALELSPDHAETHAWYAYLCGKISDLVSTKERIQRGYDVQTHLEAAIKGKPTDHALYYTYGRWAMEVAKLGWAEKKIAAMLFATPPTSSYEEAIEKFKKADELKANWRANQFYIASSYINLKNYKEAIQWLDKAMKCETTDEEDELVVPEMEKLHKKYASYRESAK